MLVGAVIGDARWGRDRASVLSTKERHTVGGGGDRGDARPCPVRCRGHTGR